MWKRSVKIHLKLIFDHNRFRGTLGFLVVISVKFLLFFVFSNGKWWKNEEKNFWPKNGQKMAKKVVILENRANCCKSSQKIDILGHFLAIFYSKFFFFFFLPFFIRKYKKSKNLTEITTKNPNVLWHGCDQISALN